MRVTDAAGDQQAASAPLNQLVSVGCCPQCVKEAVDAIMGIIQQRGTQASRVAVASALASACDAPRHVELSSHNSFRSKMGVVCSNHGGSVGSVYSDIPTTAPLGKGGSGGQGEFSNRMRKHIGYGRTSENAVRRFTGDMGMGGMWDSTRLGTKAHSAAVEAAERIPAELGLTRMLSAVPRTLSARRDWTCVKEVALGTMGPLLKDLVEAVRTGVYHKLTLPLREQLIEHKVSELQHDWGDLQIEERDGCWVAYSSTPCSFEVRGSFTGSVDGQYGPGRTSSIGHVTTMLHPGISAAGTNEHGGMPFMSEEEADAELADAAGEVVAERAERAAQTAVAASAAEHTDAAAPQAAATPAEAEQALAGGTSARAMRTGLRSSQRAPGAAGVDATDINDCSDLEAGPLRTRGAGSPCIPLPPSAPPGTSALERGCDALSCGDDAAREAQASCADGADSQSCSHASPADGGESSSGADVAAALSLLPRPRGGRSPTPAAAAAPERAAAQRSALKRTPGAASAPSASNALGCAPVALENGGNRMNCMIASIIGGGPAAFGVRGFAPGQPAPPMSSRTQSQQRAIENAAAMVREHALCAALSHRSTWDSIGFLEKLAYVSSHGGDRLLKSHATEKAGHLLRWEGSGSAVRPTNVDAFVAAALQALRENGELGWWEFKVLQAVLRQGLWGPSKGTKIKPVQVEAVEVPDWSDLQSVAARVAEIVRQPLPGNARRRGCTRVIIGTDGVHFKTLLVAENGDEGSQVRCIQRSTEFYFCCMASKGNGLQRMLLYVTLNMYNLMLAFLACRDRLCAAKRPAPHELWPSLSSHARIAHPASPAVQRPPPLRLHRASRVSDAPRAPVPSRIRFVQPAAHPELRAPPRRQHWGARRQCGLRALERNAARLTRPAAQPARCVPPRLLYQDARVHHVP